MIDKASCGICRDDLLNALNACRISTDMHLLSPPEHLCCQPRYGWQFASATRPKLQPCNLSLPPRVPGGDIERKIDAVGNRIGSATSPQDSGAP
jgi:hypothetical protein